MKTLGPRHPALAQTLGNLGELASARHNFAEAETLLRKAMSIYEKALGPDHPLLSETISDLGALYRKQDRFDEADPLLRRALAIQEKALGPDHPMVAECLDNLALVALGRGRLDESARSSSVPWRSRRRPSAPTTRSWPGPSPTTPAASARAARSPMPSAEEARARRSATASPATWRPRKPPQSGINRPPIRRLEARPGSHLREEAAASSAVGIRQVSRFPNHR